MRKVSPSILDYLIAIYGVNTPDNNGNTALHTAAITNKLATVRHLVEIANADLNFVNEKGHKAVDIARGQSERYLRAKMESN